ncbi:MarR family winged helix-turn-helix transcriptional regulator [Microbacterium sediminicola]|uniref:MarR family winged helix-turn-helix transcriptional regulator n=1 Tax=Microbacterium sediminicola TaxID=415210 RepID=UPI0031D77449
MLHDVDTPSLLSLAGASVDARVLRALRRAGHTRLRPRHGYVFQRLLRGPQSISELARDLSVSQQAMSKTVAELRDLGYVAVTQSSDDLRRRSLELTEHARDAIECARDARVHLARDLLGGLGEADHATLRRALSVLLEQLGVAEDVRERRFPPDTHLTEEAARNTQPTRAAASGGASSTSSQRTSR